jgi:hypothetical protein
MNATVTETAATTVSVTVGRIAACVRSDREQLVGKSTIKAHESGPAGTAPSQMAASPSKAVATTIDGATQTLRHRGGLDEVVLMDRH